MHRSPNRCMVVIAFKTFYLSRVSRHKRENSCNRELRSQASLKVRVKRTSAYGGCLAITGDEDVVLAISCGEPANRL